MSKIPFCVFMSDELEIDTFYSKLNFYGTCVDYNDEKQIKKNKQIIVGKILKKFTPEYPKGNRHENDCLTLLCQKGYPKECLTQDGALFRLMTRGLVVAQIVDIEINTYIAFLNPEMYKTYNSSMPTFIIGSGRTFVWIASNVKCTPEKLPRMINTEIHNSTLISPVQDEYSDSEGEVRSKCSHSCECSQNLEFVDEDVLPKKSALRDKHKNCTKELSISSRNSLQKSHSESNLHNFLQGLRTHIDQSNCCHREHNYMERILKDYLDNRSCTHSNTNFSKNAHHCMYGKHEINRLDLCRNKRKCTKIIYKKDNYCQCQMCNTKCNNCFQSNCSYRDRLHCHQNNVKERHPIIDTRLKTNIKDPNAKVEEWLDDINTNLRQQEKKSCQEVTVNNKKFEEKISKEELQSKKIIESDKNKQLDQHIFSKKKRKLYCAGPNARVSPSIEFIGTNLSETDQSRGILKASISTNQPEQCKKQIENIPKKELHKKNNDNKRKLYHKLTSDSDNELPVHRVKSYSAPKRKLKKMSIDNIHQYKKNSKSSERSSSSEKIVSLRVNKKQRRQILETSESSDCEQDIPKSLNLDDTLDPNTIVKSNTIDEINIKNDSKSTKKIIINNEIIDLEINKLDSIIAESNSTTSNDETLVFNEIFKNQNGNNVVQPTQTYYDAEGSQEKISSQEEELKELFKTLSDNSATSLEKLFSFETHQIREEKLANLKELNQTVRIKGVLVDIFPELNDLNRFSIVQGFCLSGCKQRVKINDIPFSKAVSYPKCNHCKLIMHHICPLCQKEKEVNNYLCIKFCFELFVLYGENIIRILVSGRNAEKFIGHSLRHYLNYSAVSSDVIAQFNKVIISTPPEDWSQVILFKLNLKTIKLKDNMIIPKLYNTYFGDSMFRNGNFISEKEL